MQNDARSSGLEESLSLSENDLSKIERFVDGLQGSFKVVATNGVDSLLQKEIYIGEILFREIKEDGPSAYSYDIQVLRIKDGKRACYEILLDFTAYYFNIPSKPKYRVNDYSNKEYLQKAVWSKLKTAGTADARGKETDKLYGGKLFGDRNCRLA